jgi:hypothetical protein
MLPAPVNMESRFSRPRLTSAPTIREYFKRVAHYAQMDLDYAFWQMICLVCSPSKVYELTSYRKQTKNQWARDDPAFVVVLVGFLVVLGLAYGVAFQVSGWKLVHVIMVLVGVHFLLAGVVVATLCWFVCNNYLRVSSLHGVEQSIEWLYAFDIHCNSFFPFFLILYVLHYFFLPFLLQPSFSATVVSAVFYLAAYGYYAYITSLGYSALPFLEKTEVFLYPVTMLVGMIVLLCLGNVNLSRVSIYFLGLGVP